MQTFTLGVTRSLPGNMILDVKYLGTRGVKLHSSINYNEPDFQNNGLLQALTITRAGGNAAMFDQMFNGLNFGTGIGVVGRDVTGSEALRRHASFRADIANGNFRNVANTLNTANIGVTVPAGQTIAGGTLRSSGLFPENFITANPQFGVMEMRNNSDSSNYHSLQTQLTMRPKHGITYQATWTWSRATGVAPPTGDGGGTTETYRDFMNRHADYTVASFQRTHNFRGYATFELPFGPGRSPRFKDRRRFGARDRRLAAWHDLRFLHRSAVECRRHHDHQSNRNAGYRRRLPAKGQCRLGLTHSEITSRRHFTECRIRPARKSRQFSRRSAATPRSRPTLQARTSSCRMPRPDSWARSA